LAHAEDRATLDGAQWLLLQDALADSTPFTSTLRACAECMAELKPQLRHLLHYHCGVRTLRSRQMMLDIQAL
jgi:DNA repair protein RecO (recombination protein O)